MDPSLVDLIHSDISYTAWVALGVSLLLLLISAFMSSSEVAFFSLSPQELGRIKEEEDSSDPTLYKLLSKPDRLLATILIGNNIVNVGVVILTGYAFSLVFDFSTAPVIGFIFQTVILTLLLLLFGEISPKIYAQSRPLSFSRFSAPYMASIDRVLSPCSNFLVNSTQVVTKWMHKKQYNISVDELSAAVDLLGDHKPEEKAMFEEIISFYGKTASEIMIPRIDMVTVDISWEFDRMLAFVIESGYSRIPVHEGNQDNIQGIIYVKDLIPHKEEKPDFQWANLIRKAYFVPENKPLDDLLEEFRSNKIHISIVVDEFGGTSGLVTMEDLLEEIVGEISDEYDEEALPYKKLNDGTYLFEAKTPINDVLRFLDLEDDAFGPSADEVDTLGGLVLELKQDLPRLGDTVSAHGWSFKVMQMERFRIIEVLVVPPSLAQQVSPTPNAQA